jgi:HlyD family secretion protein
MKISTLLLASIITVFTINCGNDHDSKKYTSILEGTTIQVPALTGGQILEISTDEGKEVKQGDRMVRIDSLELFLQYQQLSASYEEITAQKRIAITALERSERDLAYVRQKYERIEKLYHANSVAKQDFDDITNQLSQVSSSRESAAQNLQTLTARQKQIEAQIALNRKKVHDTIIVSPADGIVTTKYYETGEAVASLRPVVEIMDISRLKAKIYIQETMLPEVRQGQQVAVAIDGSDKSFSGTVSWISPRAEFTPKSILTPDTRTSLVYAVEIDIANQDGIMKDGMPVIITL